MLVSVTCTICTQVFEYDHRGGRRRTTCSADCRRKAKLAYLRNYSQGHYESVQEVHVQTCEQCGEDFAYTRTGRSGYSRHGERFFCSFRCYRDAYKKGGARYPQTRNRPGAALPQPQR